jgi:hypothetical protein
MPRSPKLVVPRCLALRCFALCSFAALGCERPIPDPPPKASPTEIPAAPANALGSLAAGTDGAPKIGVDPQMASPTPPSPEFELTPPGGAAPGGPVPSPSPSAQSVPL